MKVEPDDISVVFNELGSMVKSCEGKLDPYSLGYKRALIAAQKKLNEKFQIVPTSYFGEDDER